MITGPTRSLYFTLGLPMIIFVVVWALLVSLGLLTLERVRSDVERASYLGTERSFYELLYLASQLPAPGTREAAPLLSELSHQIEQNERMLSTLVDGDTAVGVPLVRDPNILAQLEETRRYWTSEVRPSLERAMENAPLSAPAIRNLERLIEGYATRLERQIDLVEQTAAARLEQARFLLLSSAAVIVVGFFTLMLIIRYVARRMRALVRTTEEISAGQLSRRAPTNGSDELALLGSSFNAMTDRLATMIESERNDRARLEDLIRTISETAQQLAASAAEILAGTSQQVEGMREQSAAVAETATSVDEVLQTAEQATQRAETVAASSEAAVEVSSSGRKAVDETVSVMHAVSERTEAIAEDILALAESSQEIGEIVAFVTEIADQTNLLALNAAIEASRAGEHGHGFSIVASEIKALADESKASTGRVRRILIDIQNRTNTAVIGMEEGAKSVNRALEKVDEAGETIRKLEHIIADASRSASQISASAGQQRAGMKQIHDAMHHIEHTSRQNLAAVRQAEQAARDLNELGDRLRAMLDGGEN